MITREVLPVVPADCEVCGFLFEADSHHELSQDMLDVALPNGVLVIAGWFPDGGPNGCYRVAVYRGYDEIVPANEFEDIDLALQDVEQRVQEFLGRNYAATDSESTVHNYDFQRATT